MKFHSENFLASKFLIAGKSKTISTSKIKKIIVIKKNRNEKGKRDFLLISNPHSNGEVFSRSRKDFELKITAINIITMTIIKIRKIKVKMCIIIFSMMYWTF